MSEQNRPLGSEMQAERWEVIGGDWIMWLHPPSCRCVAIEGPIAWESCMQIPAVPSAPASADVEGYLVACRVHDELGNPVDGDIFWVESYGCALRYARRIRSLILEGSPLPAERAKQLSLFDAGIMEVRS